MGEVIGRLLAKDPNQQLPIKMNLWYEGTQ